MVQIGPIKYNKSEEAILTRSFFIGVFLGVPLGILVNYLFGFPTIHTQTPTSFLGWTRMLFTFFISFLIVPCILTTVSLILFLRKKERLNASQHFFKAFWSVIMFFLFLPIYTAITSSAILVPFDTFLYPLFGEKWMLTLHAFSGLIVVPFIILFIAIIGPDSKPGKALRNFIGRLRKK